LHDFIITVVIKAAANIQMLSELIDLINHPSVISLFEIGGDILTFAEITVIMVSYFFSKLIKFFFNIWQSSFLELFKESIELFLWSAIIG